MKQRLVFPTDENMGYLSKRGAHFGKAKFYTIVTVENGKIMEVEGVANPGHGAGGCGNAVANIMALGPDALVVGGIGASPAQGFKKAGLPLFVDRESATVEQSVKRFFAAQLQQVDQGTCEVH